MHDVVAERKPSDIPQIRADVRGVQEIPIQRFTWISGSLRKVLVIDQRHLGTRCQDLCAIAMLVGARRDLDGHFCAAPAAILHRRQWCWAPTDAESHGRAAVM